FVARANIYSSWILTVIAEHPEPLAAYTTRAEPWDEPAWCRVLARERNGVQAPAVPTYVYHVTDDEIVPAWLGRELARTYRVQGTDVTWVEVPATDHLAGAHHAADAAVDWLATIRLRGDRSFAT
ncbi:MAG TPA: lipase family protein, partial [Nocardioides sp.]|nr:lipase family protein [Nocardioides sp.]